MQIRPARTTDPAEVERLFEICVRTGAAGQDASALYQNPRLLPLVYLGAYLHIEPELAFVIADDDGTAHGYVCGTANSREFERQAAQSWWPALQAAYPLGAYPSGSADARLVRLMHEPATAPQATVPSFPAHLHIDLLPSAQGGGNGRKLMDTFFAALRARSVPGVHLGLDTSNEKAIGFYRHLGFELIDPDIDWLFGLPLS